MPVVPSDLRDRAFRDQRVREVDFLADARQQPLDRVDVDGHELPARRLDLLGLAGAVRLVVVGVVAAVHLCR